MIAVDTSVVVAGFASWHEGHRSAVAALARKPRIPAHALVESYSVLTRLPPPHRAPPDLVEAFLADRFSGSALALPPGAFLDLVREARRAGVAGGAIYDALVAAEARKAGAKILTRDRRALPTYEAIGVEYELLT